MADENSTTASAVGADEKSKKGFMDGFSRFSNFATPKAPEENKTTEGRSNLVLAFGRQFANAISTPTRFNAGSAASVNSSLNITPNAENAADVFQAELSTQSAEKTSDRSHEHRHLHRPSSMSLNASMFSHIEGDVDFLDLNLGDPDITTEDIDFDGMDEDLRNFQQDKNVRDALSKGVNLREFARQIESDLRAVEKESIQDYIQESEHLAKLHKEIQMCDGILETMETMLSNFQTNLGNISSEIKLLQDQSHSMTVSLANRKKVEEDMVSFIERVAVPASLIKSICEDPINERFIDDLKVLHDKLVFCSTQRAQAIHEISPELERLKIKAISRSRDHLINLFNQLKKPNTNVQIIQQSSMLKYKYMNQFLNHHAHEIAREIQDTYADAMSRIILGTVKKYIGAVQKLSVEVATRADLLGAEESQLKSFITTRVATKGKSSVFTLAGRDEVLLMIEKDAIVPHHASQANQKFPFEVIFRSMQHFLVEAATSEFLFILEFFGRAELFQAVFGKSIAVYQETLTEALQTSYDAVGLFLLICVTNKHQLVMNRRRIPSLESYFDATNMHLWTRFKVVFDMNMESIRTVQVRSLWKSDFHPHYVTRRYAEFVASLLILNKDYNSSTIIQNLNMLQKEMDKFLVKLSECYPVKKHQNIFLINNYDVILSTFEENSLSAEDMQPFQLQLDSYTRRFVEDELKEFFGPLINYVMTIEIVAENSIETARTQVPEAKVLQIIREFSVSWTKNIEKMNASIQTYFSNFKNGQDILKQLLSQLMLYYTRFFNLVRKVHPKEAFTKDLIPTNSVAFEARKYHRNLA